MLTRQHPDPLYSPAETAEALGCHHQTVRKLIRDGTLNAIRLSARRLGIRQSEIERHLSENEGR
jgi:excisionase family DNA binding protein